MIVSATFMYHVLTTSRILCPQSFQDQPLRSICYLNGRIYDLIADTVDDRLWCYDISTITANIKTKPHKTFAAWNVIAWVLEENMLST